MSRRLYLGSAHISLFLTQSQNQFLLSPGLPADTRSEDVNKFFEGYGRIVDCRVMTGALLVFYSYFVTKTCFQVLAS